MGQNGKDGQNRVKPCVPARVNASVKVRVTTRENARENTRAEARKRARWAIRRRALRQAGSVRRGAEPMVPESMALEPMVPEPMVQEQHASASGASTQTNSTQSRVWSRGLGPELGDFQPQGGHDPHKLWVAPKKVLFIRKLPPFWRRVDDNSPATPEKIRLWRLVCSALRIPYRQVGNGLVVPAFYEKTARSHFTAVAAEGHRILPPSPVLRHNIPHALLLLSLLLLWFLVTRHWGTVAEWNNAGALRVWDTIHNGQWYRVFTALTLHSDGQHLFSNLLFGAPFFVLLCRRAGLGPAALLTVLSGGLGNVGNVMYRVFSNSQGHVSMGFSTALFGIAGALTGFMAVGEILHALRGHQLARQSPAAAEPPHRQSMGLGSGMGAGLRRAFVFMAAGVAVLALLGSDPAATTDYAAHIFGLLAGLLCGGIYGFWGFRGILQERMATHRECLAGGLAALILIVSWLLGLSE